MIPGMTGTRARLELVDFLSRTGDACRQTLATGGLSTTAESHLRRHVLPAVALLQTLSLRAPVEDADIRLARDLCSDAAAACRTQAPTIQLLALVSCLEQVVDASDAALAGGEAAEPHWERFLFKDLDVHVRRAGRRWILRGAGGRCTENVFLDAALDSLVSLSTRRIGEVTVQILDWFEHKAAAGR
jgi:hypothetical protein